MPATAVALVLVSAVLHAGWNAYSKQSGPSAARFFVIAVFGALLVVPIVVVYREHVLQLPRTAIYGLIATGFCQAVYFVGLAGAYRHGHISVAYPIARAVPIIAIALLVAGFGAGDAFTKIAILGIGCVIVGCFLVPMHHLRDLRLSHYTNRSVSFALLAAAGTTGYTVIDDAVLRSLKEGPDWDLGDTRTAFLYLTLETWSTLLWLAPVAVSSRVRRAETRAIFATQKRAAAVTAVMVYLSYGLVLASYTLAANVGYIAAFRQAAIPIGAAMGIVWFREPITAPKTIGLIVLTSGLVLVAAY